MAEEKEVVNLSYGERLIGVTLFNKNPKVKEAKELMAKAVDLIQNDHNEVTHNGAAMISEERRMLKTKAITDLVSTQMLMVKILTWDE